MRFSEIHVTPPRGFVDKTPYFFTADEPNPLLQERLTFSYDVIPVGIRDLQSLVAYRIDQLKEVTPGEVVISEDTTVQLDRYAGRAFLVEQRSGDHSIRTHCVMAFGAQSEYIQLTYSTPLSSVESSVRFRLIYKSVRFGEGQTDPSPKGFKRRSAGIATLDVPSELRPPSQLRFVRADLGDTIEMNVLWPDTPDTAASMSSLVTQDGALAESLRQNPADTIVVQGGSAELVSYVLTRRRFDETEETVVWRARIRFATGTVVSVMMRLRNDERFVEHNNGFLAVLRQVREQS